MVELMISWASNLLDFQGYFSGIAHSGIGISVIAILAFVLKWLFGIVKYSNEKNVMVKAFNLGYWLAKVMHKLAIRINKKDNKYIMLTLSNFFDQIDAGKDKYIVDTFGVVPVPREKHKII